VARGVGDRRAQVVVVVGGGGYSGVPLVRKLLDEGYRVRVFDSFLFGNDALSSIGGDEPLEIVKGDVRHIEEIGAALSGAKYAIMLAGIVGTSACLNKPREAVEVNVLATASLFRSAKVLGVERIVFASSHHVYGRQSGVLTEECTPDPSTVYGRQKLEAERVLLELASDDFHPIILRMSTLFGLSPRMEFALVLNALARDATTTGAMTIIGGDQWRPLLHVADAAAAYAAVLRARLETVSGQIFNVADIDHNYTIREIADRVARVVPAVVNEVPAGESDRRGYRVSGEKLRETVGFVQAWSPEDGAREISAAIRHGRLATTAPST